MFKILLNLRIPVILLLVLVTSVSSDKIQIRPHSPSRKLDHISVWLSEYVEADKLESGSSAGEDDNGTFSSELISRIGSDYVISQNVDGVVMACEADFPIQWTFPHPNQIEDVSPFTLHIRDYRKSSLKSGLSQVHPLSVGYISYLLVLSFGFKFLSVNVTCAGVEQSRRNASAFLYFKKEYDIENKGQKVDVLVKPGTVEQDIVIPCRPADPGDNVTLYSQKRGKDGSLFWEEFHLPPNSHSWRSPSREDSAISFSPKTGFTLHNTILPFTGVFKCVLEDSDDHALIRVKAGEPTSGSFTPHSHLSENASVALNPRGGGGNGVNFVCCSGKDTEPIVQGLICDSAHHCDILKKTQGWKAQPNRYWEKYLHRTAPGSRKGKGCASEFYISNVAVVTCQGDTVDFAEEYVTLASGATIPASKASLENLESKAWISIGKPFKWQDMLSKGQSYFFNGLYRPVNESSLQFNSWEWSSKGRKNGLDVMVLGSNDTLFEGESFHLICAGVNYFYAGGPRMRVYWNNKTDTVVESMAAFDDHFGVVRLYGTKARVALQNLQTTSVISTRWTATRGLKLVECYLPRRDSDQWDVTSIGFNVLPSTPPKFAGESEETIYVRLGEVGKVILCQLSEGLPIPPIVMTKDGLPLVRKFWSQFKPYLNVSVPINLRNGSLTLPQITYEMQGVYECIGENFKGSRATKRIRVIITDESDSSTSLLWIVVGCIAVIVLGIIVLGVVGWGYWWQHKRLQQSDNSLRGQTNNS